MHSLSRRACRFLALGPVCPDTYRKGVVLPGVKLLLPESIADGINTSDAELPMRLACGISEEFEFTGVSTLACETRF